MPEWALWPVSGAILSIIFGWISRRWVRPKVELRLERRIDWYLDVEHNVKAWKRLDRNLVRLIELEG